MTETGRGEKPLDLGKYHLDCKLFNGYKPCHPGWVCPGCNEYDPVQEGIRLSKAESPLPKQHVRRPSRAGCPPPLSQESGGGRATAEEPSAPNHAGVWGALLRGKGVRPIRRHRQDPEGETRVLLINLGAGGDVLRTTAILPAIKRKYPGAFLTWLTDPSSIPVLLGNPLVDRLLPYEPEGAASLLQETFNVILNVDKDLRAAALMDQMQVDRKFGFGLWRRGVICPVNDAALELFDLGVNDQFRFFENRKSLQQLFAQSLELEYRGEEYLLVLTEEEEGFVLSYRREIGVSDGEVVVGINTGCSDRIPYRRFIFEKHVELIETLERRIPGIKIALLGGREDTQTNDRLKGRFGDRVISTPTTLGLRKGICFVKACDLIITGDSVGLHIAIALKKPTVVWFGPTSEHEIDLYGRGVKLVTQLACHPCWKKFCDFQVKCNEVVEIDRISEAVRSLLTQPTAA